MIWIIPFALPTLCLAWVLTPWAVREGDRARKRLLWATYPRESRNGNNPASQRVHEGGGLRAHWLLVFWPAMVAAGTVAHLALPDQPWLDHASLVVAAQVACILPAFFLTQRWIDIAEHAAEVMHAERAGMAGYRDAEAARMTAPGQGYDKMTPDQFKAAMAGAAWWAKIILKLGSW